MQKVTPFLWFDANAEEAMNFYTSLFSDGKILNSSPGPDGKMMVGTFSIGGYQFMALNGGPLYKFTPAISFFIYCKTESQINELWQKLSDGGKILMEFGKYPFSKKYGWVNDKYGVSWQLHLTETETKIVPCLLFTGKQAGKAQSAIDFYTSLFKDGKTMYAYHYEEGEGDKPEYLKHAGFSLAGQDFIAMDSGFHHAFTFNEAVSLFVNCEDQKEVDYFWNSFTKNGESGQCGWLKDEFGVSWQIIPKQLGELMGDPDREKANRVLQAMLKMQKIDISDLEKAAKAA